MTQGMTHLSLFSGIGGLELAKGVKDRVSRLKCLGNAVVPQQFYPIFQAIWEVEMGGCT